MNLYPLSEIIEIATKRGIFLGKGTPQNRIAYFVKTGLIPHAIRKTNPRTGKIEAHFPLSILETIEEINHLKRKSYSHYQIKASLVPQAQNFSADQVQQVQEEINIPRFSYRIHNPRVLVAAFAVLLIAVLYSNFLLSFVPSRPQGNAVLGVETFIAPVVQEVSPLLSPLTRFVSNLGNSVRLGIGTFLLSLLPLDFQTKTEGEGSSTTTTTIVQSGDIPSDLVLQSLTVEENAGISGNLLVSGTINTNTFTGNKLVFSGSSPSIYPSTTNTSISLNASGTGAINIGNSGTGDVYLAGGSGDGGCTITNSSGSLNCSGNITTAGDLIANGGDILTDLSTLTLGNSSQTVRIPGTLTITKAPTLPHTGTWSIGASSWNVSDSSFYINPSTATADSNLFGLAINGAVRFAVDAEGDTYVNNLILAGNITSATTTVSGDLTVEGNTTLGDSTTDTITLNPATITLAGGNKTLDLTGAATRTLTLLNSTSSQVTDLDLSDGSLKLAGTTRISNAGGGTLDNLTVNPSSSSQVALTIKGATSQSVDLLQIKNSLDAVIAKVDQLGNITGNTLTSTVATGTAPLTVASTTMVTNLNANYLGGSAAADLGYSTNPNLILNSDFSRRNKWMTFMPEVFSDTSGWTLVTGSSIGSVASNILTAGNGGAWRIRAGLSTWRDARYSAQFKWTSDDAGTEIGVEKFVDTSNRVFARYRGTGVNGIAIHKVIAGSTTANLCTASYTATVNNWYWIELEAQGTTYIAKFYSSGASPVAKSSATLVATCGAVTISDSAVTSGYIAFYSETTTATQLGGLSSGDGGVYVEGFGPENWTVTFGGTTGGQAFGYDEAADSGPLSKQLTPIVYIPATSRTLTITQNGTDGVLDSSTSYIHSAYVKNTGLGGSGTMVTFRTAEQTSGSVDGTLTDVSDAAETSWTRKTSSAFTTASTARRFSQRILVNPSSTRTGTVRFSLPQLEKGSVATPWKRHTGDLAPLVQVFTNSGVWTKPAGAKWVEVIAIGAGGGGAGGAGNGAGIARNGASGGGGGAIADRLFDPSALGGTESVTIGAAGTAGTGGTNANGAAGGGGGNSSFGSHLSAYGGAGGGVGQSGGGGGGTASAGSGTSGGGPALPATATTVNRMGGGGAFGQTADLPGGIGEYGGGSGGTGGSNGSIGNVAGGSLHGGGGGGGGGGVTAANVQGAGFPGGASGSYATGGGGTGGAVDGTAGGPGTSRSGTGKSSDGGGGGGGNGSGTGGAGGAGGVPGGGGGGGGGGTTTGGTGGAGGRGEVIVITTIDGAFDLAEEYSVIDETIDAGDVVSLLQGTTVEKATKGYQQDIFGIISSEPGITLGNFTLNNDGKVNSELSYDERYSRTNLRPVALQGRVPVKVTSENGPIKRGDILTSSATKPGYAMKATKAGRSIGIAMEDFAPQEQSTIYDLPLTSDESSTSSGQIVNSQPSIVTGKIMTFVNLSFYDPDVYLADSGQLVIQKTQNTQSISESVNQILGTSDASGSADLLSFPSIPKFTLFNTQTNETIERTGAFNDLFVANLKVGRLDASEITELIKLEQRIKSLELATTSAVLSASISGLLNDNEATNSGILNSLIVSGKTILSDLGVTGTITNGLLSIDGLQNTISSLADLKFQLPGGEVTIDTSGNLKVGKVQIEELVVTSSALGKATLNAGQLSVEISSTYVKEDSRIFLTPITKTNKQILNATITGVGKFNVEIEEPQAFDINFNYLIVNAN